MLAFRATKLEEINSIYAQEGLEKNELNAFAKVFGEYHTNAQAKLAQISASTTKYSERNIAGNELARFFDALGFQTQIDQESGAQSVNSAIDLALLQNGSVKVIIEAKLPESITKSKQMFSAQNPNCKALHEAILYYLREVVDKQNFSVETIIITDFTRFFIFGYKEFERLFAKNAKIKDIFAKYKNDTSNFYAKAQGILDLLNDEICGVCVDLSSLAGLTKATPAQSAKNQNPSHLQNPEQSQNLATSTTQALTPKGKKSLETLCKIFHKDFLFGEFKQSNPLSPRFYNELLYILGLSEYKRSGKILILPSKESLEGANTLYHLIITQLQATHPSEVQNLDFVMQYIILWLNRILFLKLIEANLIRFNDDKALAFLNKSKLKDYQALSHLFFEILAKEHSKRPKDSPLAYLPHLNSSLFERQPCEEVLEISMLDNSAEFSYYATTQVRKEGKRQAGKVNLLSYIFEFLDAFDFGSGESETRNNDISGYEGEDSRIIEQKELIKTNVLGLVFEKLNGYKEGSFYTPNFITSYMCRISLEQVVLERFNEANPKWNATSLAQLAELIRDERERKDEFKAILRGVRICDPSVGSGHFLVSALCEMIRIYHSLRLSDELNEYELKIDDDEIIIYVAKDKVFDYKKPTKPNENSQAVQKCLFTLKKSIIQNNLFGVDINPNSVEICKLRLWIELLKNSYYLTQESEGFDESLRDSYHQMQTLPNIDINIKCGNSLISYLAINEPLPIKITEKIKTYQELEKDYFHAMYEDRQAHINKIQNIKQELTNSYFKTKFHNKIESLIKECDIYAKNFGNFGKESLSEHYKFLKENIHISSMLAPSEDDINKARAKKDLENLKKSHDEIFSLQGTFEWRIEFSKLLNAGLSTEQIAKNNQSKIKGDTQNIIKNKKGDFMGFDLIIGNPPYISQEEIKDLKPNLKKAFNIYSSTSDIYTYFYEQGYNLLKNNGTLSLITSNKFCRSGYGENLRAFLLNSTTILDFVDLNGVKVFDKATVDTCIINLLKSKPPKSHLINYANPKSKDLSNLTYKHISQSILTPEIYLFLDSTALALKAKIEASGTPLEEWVEVNSGIKTGYNEAFIIDTKTKDKILADCKTESERKHTKQIIKKMLKGEHIKRYGYEWANLWLINTHNGYSLPNGDKIPPIDIKQYPALKKHFDKKARLNVGKGKGFLDRDDKGITPYNLRNCAYVEDFNKPKIMLNKASQINAFYLDNEGEYYGDVTTYILKADKFLYYLLGVLNSKMFYLAYNAFYVGGGIEGELTLFTLKKFPIPKPNAKNKKIADEITALVTKILECKKQGKDTSPSTQLCHTERSEVSQKQKRDFSLASLPQNDKIISDLESKIDDLVYQLYELTQDEIKTIQST
ncbi:Eco57I restriction-modification methylase domain-containing protein [Helicobacter sp. MIT 01-3238]|uniref:type IIG restriction enzyme/methyltransferase n=1 Tax=Helicobacter sp. MIT 01-3238 TaxID=398627 RepID=UPI000E1E8C28|nr:Eco57I restriction-modification methylase domain-containing protein [Helicobacter sp. MIT 01-3238]RDU53776.1 restriction endonuclease [Helicobacter sp. MIT 01-3238]